MQHGASCQHEPVAEAEERTECVCEHWDLVPAPPRMEDPGEETSLWGASRAGGKRLLCWLGMLSGSTSEPAPSTRNLLGPSLGCQETEGGTENHLRGHVVVPWPSMEGYMSSSSRV